MQKSSSEIEKLTERISKDPKSKLFVPLAEEYKKAGDIERAIAVLREGINTNPGYVIAKSFLGRLLLDKGNLVEAQKEFQEVIKLAPDNVLAQRKLGDIYALQGKTAEALECFKAVLAFNPKDAELISLIADIEAGREVKGKISGTKRQSAADQSSTAVNSPPAALGVSSALAVSDDTEEPEEVLIFELLDAENTGVAEKLPVATRDLFAELAPEPASNALSLSTDDSSGIVDAGQGRMETGTALSSESGVDLMPQPEAAVPEQGIPLADEGFQATGLFDDGPVQEETRTEDIGGAVADLIPDFGAALEPERESVRADTELTEKSLFEGEVVPAEQAAAEDEETIANLIPDFGMTPEPEGESVSADDSLAGSVLFDEGAAKLDRPFDSGETDAAFLTSEAEAASEAQVRSGFDVPPTDGGFFTDEEETSEVSFVDDSKSVEPRSVVAREGNDPDTSFLTSADTEVPSEERSSESDDFTTDTLAELYIAQGFYEKAIDIYQRMLLDRPNSKALKDKLENVRSMGGSQVGDEEMENPVLLEQQESPEASSQPSLANVEPKQWKAFEAEHESEPEPQESLPPVEDYQATTTIDPTFTPRAYVPLTEQSVMPGQPLKREPPVFAEEQVSFAPQQIALPGRERTIYRLENWLNNIMKER